MLSLASVTHLSLTRSYNLQPLLSSANNNAQEKKESFQIAMKISSKIEKQ